MRVVICGGPRVGKTTLASRLLDQGLVPMAAAVRCTDEVINKFSWSNASLEVASWFDAPEPWIIEGTIAVRALRKWIGQSASMHAKPCDVVYYCVSPRENLTSQQITMLMGIETIWNEIRNELRSRHVDIRYA